VAQLTVRVLTAMLLQGVAVVPPSAQQLDLRPVLSLLDEKPLELLPDHGRTFRFIWLPPFPSARIISVRVQDVGQGAELVAKAASWGKAIDTRVERRLTETEWQALADDREDGLWKYPPEEYPQAMHDGQVWVFEGVAAGECLRLVQHVPRMGAFKDACRRMFLLSGIKLSEHEHLLEGP